MAGKNRTQIKKAVRDGLRSTGESIFSLSQQTDLCYVPVDKGTLKKSGYVKNLSGGLEIGYLAPYASDVEFGNPFRPFLGTQRITIKAHNRRGYKRKDGISVPATTVKAHVIEFVNKRLIAFKPKHSKFERGPMIFRVLKGQPARDGQFFLTRAFLERIGDLPKNIMFAAQMNSKVKEARLK